MLSSASHLHVLYPGLWAHQHKMVAVATHTKGTRRCVCSRPRSSTPMSAHTHLPIVLASPSASTLSSLLARALKLPGANVVPTAR